MALISFQTSSQQILQLRARLCFYTGHDHKIGNFLWNVCQHDLEGNKLSVSTSSESPLNSNNPPRVTEMTFLVPQTTLPFESLMVASEPGRSSNPRLIAPATFLYFDKTFSFTSTRPSFNFFPFLQNIVVFSTNMFGKRNQKLISSSQEGFCSQNSITGAISQTLQVPSWLSFATENKVCTQAIEWQILLGILWEQNQ